MFRKLTDNPSIYVFSQSVLAHRGHKAIKSFISELVSPDARVLDLGCGTGDYSVVFKHYTGIDSNPEVIRYAREKYSAKFVCGNALSTGFKRSHFDAVVSVGLLHHLNDRDAKKVFLEADRVTKQGGVIIIVDACYPLSPINLIGLLVRKMDKGRYIRKIEQTLNLIPRSWDSSWTTISGFPLDYVAIVRKKY